MEFEWDYAKAILNFATHRISFEQAKAAFSDEFAIELIDDRGDYGELRFVRIAKAKESPLLVVVYTEREERKRIISARRANTNEQKKYFRQFN
jgi:uncharacterized DUF497 family protein